MHEAQGEMMQPGPSSQGAREGTAGSRQALPLRGASPLPALARVRRVRRVPSSCALPAAGTFHPTGCYSCARFASLSERRALGCGQRLQLQPAPILPPPGDRLFTLYFLSPYPLLLLPPPTTTAGRWAASLGSCLYLRLGGGWQHRSTAAVTGSSSP